MAVTKDKAPDTKPRQRIADYFPRLKRRVVAFAIVMQVLITLVLATLLYFAKFPLLELVVYVIMPVVILQAFMNVVILKYVLAPLDILSRAIAHVSPETNDVTPPNVNGTYHERTGIKGMVDTVYGLATKDSSPVNVSDPTPTAPEVVRSIFEQIPVGIIALDADRNIIYANELAPISRNSKGAPESVSLIFQGDDNLDSWLKAREKNSVNEQHAWARIQTALPDSPDRRLMDVVASYHKQGRSGIETLVVTFDRTDHYASDEEDMDFIALAAHELRGPITVIRGYLDVLADELQPQLQPDQSELFKRLSVSASRLSGYVSNILNVSRFDRRHLQLHLHEDNLSTIYALIADDLQLRASTQGRLLSVIIPEDLPTIAADRNSLSEVLANLVDNAIKYSNEGGSIEVTAAQEGNSVVFSVTDHGIGIPSSIVGHLFTKFYRSHRSRQNVSGTGLGLYISKAIIESHGGTIGVSSSENQGSTFRFSLPMYSTVADKLLSSNNKNESVMETSNGWIKNHSMFRG